MAAKCSRAEPVKESEIVAMNTMTASLPLRMRMMSAR